MGFLRRLGMPQIAALTALMTFAVVMMSADSTPADTQPPSLDDPPVDDHEEPTTETPVDPLPGDETGPLRPFDPPPESDRAVPLDALDPDEQAYVVANQDADGWDQVHAGFSAATQQAADDAAAQAAANALGLAGIAVVGVAQ
jgi:hypothetical protein